MGKREAANDPDPETGWEAFIARHRKPIEDREEPPYIPPEKPPTTTRLEDIPADVPYADDTLTCWNGKAFVSWEKWRLSVAFCPDPPDESNKGGF